MKVFYSQKFQFTNRRNEGQIFLKAGKGEIISYPKIFITDSTIGTLNVSDFQNSIINSATIANLLCTSGTITGLNATNAIITNNLITRSTFNNLICTNGTINKFNCTNAIITTSTCTNTIITTAFVNNSYNNNLYLDNATINNSTCTKMVVSTLNSTNMAVNDKIVFNDTLFLTQPTIFLSGGNLITTTNSRTVLDGYYFYTYSTQGGCTYSSATGIFTVPISGYYSVDIQLAFICSNNAMNINLGIQNNDTTQIIVVARDSYNIHTYTYMINLSTIAYFSTGTNYTIYVRDETTDSPNVDYAQFYLDPKINRAYIYLLP